MVLADSEGRVIHINQEFAELAECEISDIEGSSIMDLLVPVNQFYSNELDVIIKEYREGLQQVLNSLISQCFHNVPLRMKKKPPIASDDTMFTESTVYIVPIYGGYQNTGSFYFFSCCYSCL